MNVLMVPRRRAVAAWSVLSKDRELLVLKAMSLGSVAVLGSGLGWLWVSGQGVWWLWTVGAVGAVCWVSVSTVFFNGAIAAGAYERLCGGDPTVRSALAAAWRRRWLLARWGLLRTSVGAVLHFVSGGRWFGRMVLAGVGEGFASCALLVVPQIVAGEATVQSAMRSSAAMLRSSWGDGAAAVGGFAVLGVTLCAPTVLVFGALASAGVDRGLAAAVCAGWVLVVAAALSALSAVFGAALYVYAGRGEVPDGFDAGLLADALVVR